MLNPIAAWSIAVTERSLSRCENHNKSKDPSLMDLPWNVSCQQDPQSGLANIATTCAPPIFGKVGRSLNVGNLDARPLGPWPHATVSRLLPASSYAVSNDTLTAKAEATNTREAMGAMNFILESQKTSNSICLSSGTLINLSTGLLGHFIPNYHLTEVGLAVWGIAKTWRQCCRVVIAGRWCQFTFKTRYWKWEYSTDPWNIVWRCLPYWERQTWNAEEMWKTVPEYLPYTQRHSICRNISRFWETPWTEKPN